MKKLLILFLMMTLNTSQAFVTVGLGPDCDYDNLFPAYNDNDPEVRVTSEQLHINDFTIDKIKVFKGGYDNCLAAQADIAGINKSRWSGLNSNNRTVVKVAANEIITMTVIIEDFEIFDGRNNTASGAGGIKVSGNTNLILRNSVVYDNEGSEGAGVHVSGEDARFSMENSIIRNNLAIGYGGGVFCTSGATVNIDADSAIHDNTADFNGGGIFAHDECQISNHSGRDHTQQNPSGIYQNAANKGGGIYLQSGSQLDNEGSATHAARITHNISSANDGLNGGGIFLTGVGTRATLLNTLIDANEGASLGAALVVTDSAQLTMHQVSQACQYAASDACSSIKGNYFITTVGEGAAGYIGASATAHIAQTEIAFNQSNHVSGFLVRDGAHLYLEGNLFRDNIGVNQNFSDQLFKIDGAVNQGARLDFIYNTAVRNGPNHIFTADNTASIQTLNVFNSIIWDQGNVFNFSGNGLTQIDCTVVHENQSLSGNVGAVLTNDPLFNNVSEGDFQLTLASDPIDFCDNNLFPNQHKDLNNQNRGVDTSSVNNAFGPYDAGAYEFDGDLIFSHGFD
ncbi:hypothetical protein [Marinicella litoralis]|uniref:Outer membrane repeat protein n=1 Tax=Marinicella litoralis TaxID=644220 RepID=A0A4R6XLF6_9GAMM|nr:hypothetical protein [Marinicella litoralis]TDR20445.1 hypothetical protein C8D91_1417 [Marinicella litoralis]